MGKATAMRNKIINGSYRKLLPLIAALALSGCAWDEVSQDNVYEPISTQERYPIEYAKGPVTMEVATGNGIMQPSQVNAVAAFARGASQGGVTPVMIKRPSGGGASARMAEEVAGLLMQSGVPQNLIRMGSYPGPAAAPVQVSYVKAYAKTKPCGDWSRDATHNSQNTQMPNHGCAVQSNIAAMIADPSHIAMPVPTSPVPAANGTSAIRRVSDGQGQTGFGSLFNIQ
jgi:pilus assembly protein CpaD